MVRPRAGVHTSRPRRQAVRLARQRVSKFYHTLKAGRRSSPRKLSRSSNRQRNEEARITLCQAGFVVFYCKDSSRLGGIVREWLALPIAAAASLRQRTSDLVLLSSGSLAKQGTRPRYPNRDNDVRGTRRRTVASHCRVKGHRGTSLASRDRSRLGRASLRVVLPPACFCRG